jgi:hypothetical protein
MGNDKCFDLLMKKNDECVVLREALEKISRFGAFADARRAVLLIIDIADAALKQTEGGGKLPIPNVAEWEEYGQTEGGGR